MAIGKRTYRAAHHAPGRMAQKSGIRHRRPGARYRGKEQANNRLRKEERGLASSTIQQKPCYFLQVQGFNILLEAQVALR